MCWFAKDMPLAEHLMFIYINIIREMTEITKQSYAHKFCNFFCPCLTGLKKSSRSQHKLISNPKTALPGVALYNENPVTIKKHACQVNYIPFY